MNALLLALIIQSILVVSGAAHVFVTRQSLGIFFIITWIASPSIITYRATSSLGWSALVLLVGFLFCLITIVVWETIRTQSARIEEVEVEEYVSELRHTFRDRYAYFSIFGKQFGPYPVVQVNAGGKRGPCFVSGMGYHVDEGGLRSHLAFRLTSYVPGS